MRSYAVVEGDRYLLCSDGLSGPVSAPEIAEALGRDEAPAAIADRLIELANAAGGARTNIAALILHCQGGHTRAVPADSVPPPPPDLFNMPGDFDSDHSDPELMILGIEDLDVSEGTESASDGLLKTTLGDLIGPGRS